ncbi:ESX secretion-associated protein EspG [Mycobacteroides abscessus subsp. abscessus]|uniref:ESX secretion-associated protein EspG n=1 Tax=Mycobacteroides abscessus TaxID=36809 RepID=UPI00266C1EAA|nr:ESX secretion-associated protein EspG [Mycobacteroides abscessus]MDO3014627.1 ESX secretion-associated protein EspG [Mycobacteroides abscessus subsp. abscessus]
MNYTTPVGRLPDTTVNIEGLWLLQALLGISRLTPELRGLPYGAARSDDWMIDNPGVAHLQEQGLVLDDGQVHPDLAERLLALAVPDVELVMVVSSGSIDWDSRGGTEPGQTPAALQVPDGQVRVVLARRKGLWVSAVRARDEVTIDAAPGGYTAAAAAVMINGLLDHVHPCGPSTMTAVTLPTDDLRSAAGAGPAQRVSVLSAAGLRGSALSEVLAAMEDPHAEAVLYGRAYSDIETYMSAAILNVRDSEQGRIVVYDMAPIRGASQEWTMVSPATVPQLEAGVARVIGSVPIARWDDHIRS